jgi:hypothetical protein
MYMKSSATILAVSVALTAVLAGCRVQVNKGANGEDKNVQVDTPFGGVHVNTDETTASDLGLPVYPGSEPYKNDDKHKSADIHVGFGEWQLHVRAVSYMTHDTRDQVTAFYKKALGRYGDVLTCQNNTPVGSPSTTSEGLTCQDDSKNSNVKIDSNDFNMKEGLQLKAGSKRHQHIVGFEDSPQGETRFALVALDLPNFVDQKGGKSD